MYANDGKRPRSRIGISHTIGHALVALFGDHACQRPRLRELIFSHEAAHLVQTQRLRTLYLGGVTNDKIGRLKLDGADRTWNGPGSYWGKGR